MLIREKIVDAQPTVNIYAGNLQLIPFTYSNSSSFSLPAIPSKKPLLVLVFNPTNAMNVPVADFTWTPGTMIISITDTLLNGDKIFVLVDMAPVDAALGNIKGNSGATYTLKVDDTDPDNLRTYPILNT